MQTLSRALMGLALLNGVAQGVNIYVSNMCDEDMTLSHVTPGGTSTEQVASGGTTTKSIEAGSASHVFKWGTGAQATREYSTIAPSKGDCSDRWLTVSFPL